MYEVSFLRMYNLGALSVLNTYFEEIPSVTDCLDAVDIYLENEKNRKGFPRCAELMKELERFLVDISDKSDWIEINSSYLAIMGAVQTKQYENKGWEVQIKNIPLHVKKDGRICIQKS